MVVGHTDDQPIKSLRYRDNYELSRERAVSVGNVLLKGLDNSARLTWRGVGSSQPLSSRIGSREPRAQSPRGNHPLARSGNADEG